MKQRKFFLVSLVSLSLLPVFMWMVIYTNVKIRVSDFRGFLPVTGTHRVLGERHTRSSNASVLVNDTVSKETLSRLKVFCWITTRERELGKKIPAVNQTWAKRCDKKMFVMTTKKRIANREIIDFKVPDGREHLTEKTIAALQYLYDNYLDEYEWFLKSDDDTYIIMENLKFLLSHYNADEGVYLGHLFKKFSQWGYMSGGAGYVLSRQALRLLVEKGYRNGSACKKTGADEDVELAHCLHTVGIPVHSTLDKFGRETFHPFSATQHLSGDLPDQLPTWDRNPTRKGEECCSQLTISFHYTDPKMMRTIDFLLYKTSVYGRKTEAMEFSNFFQVGVVPSLPPPKKS